MSSEEGLSVRVTVFGPGGVGGYLAARIAASEAADVSVIARGSHLRAIKEEGLRLESPHGDVMARPQATDDPRDIGPVDLVLLTVKGPDVPDASQRMAPLVGPDTTVVTFQNGIDSHLHVGRALGAEAVLPGIAYIFSTVVAPGVVRHTAGPGRFVFGASAASGRGRVAAVSELFTVANVEHEVPDDIDVALWSKFAIICATAGITAPSRLPIDVLREDDATRALFRDVARETVEVGRACGVALPSDAVEKVMAFVMDIGPGAYSSLLYDLLHGKPMELETLHGTVVRLADEHGVSVPVSRTIHALLAPWVRLNADGADTAALDATVALVARDTAGS